MFVAVCALLGLMVSTYLLLYSVGMLGELRCGVGSCERVQASEYAVFAGFPVPLYGVVGYVLLFTVAIVGIQSRWADDRQPGRLLAAVSTVGLAFTAYLNYAEFVILKSVCLWCTISAALITAITITSWLDALRRRPAVD